MRAGFAGRASSRESCHAQDCPIRPWRRAYIWRHGRLGRRPRARSADGIMNPCRPDYRRICSNVNRARGAWRAACSTIRAELSPILPAGAQDRCRGRGLHAGLRALLSGRAQGPAGLPMPGGQNATGWPPRAGASWPRMPPICSGTASVTARIAARRPLPMALPRPIPAPAPYAGPNGGAYAYEDGYGRPDEPRGAPYGGYARPGVPQGEPYNGYARPGAPQGEPYGGYGRPDEPRGQPITAPAAETRPRGPPATATAAQTSLGARPITATAAQATPSEPY